MDRMDLEELERLLKNAVGIVRDEVKAEGLSAETWRAGYEEYWQTRLDNPKLAPEQPEELWDSYWNGFAVACFEHRILSRDQPSPEGKEPALEDFTARLCRLLPRPGDPKLAPNNDYEDPENN
jgi:hypothetical protein